MTTVDRRDLTLGGQRLAHVGEARFVTNMVWPRSAPPAGVELNSVLELTDQELEEVLRPVVLGEGHEYTVDYSLDGFVKQLRADDGERHTSSYAPVPRAKTEHIDPDSVLVASGIIGADNRVVRRDNTLYPCRRLTYLPLAGGGYSGSGTMIGPSTALTAAHVVHNGTNWLALPSVAPGSDRDDPTPFPFGNFGGYNVTVPNGWINNNGGDARFDYAVIEFSGYGTPGWGERLEGPRGSARQRRQRAIRMYVYGHPSDKFPAADLGQRGQRHSSTPASTSTSSWMRGTATAVRASTSTTPTAGRTWSVCCACGRGHRRQHSPQLRPPHDPGRVRLRRHLLRPLIEIA